MKKFKYNLAALAVIVVALTNCVAGNSRTLAQDFNIPDPIGYVNDYEEIIDNDTELEERLREFEEETSIELVVATYPNLQGSTVEDFAGSIFDTWAIGKDTSDNGLLVFVSANERVSRIEVGYGLESALTDAKTGKIQDNYMIPHFKEGDYSAGINNAVEA
ncbi:hypothetical protein GF357_02110, partial [Candidatus Dojkabacteria bacterium]|nr:hypothetical protein [Candidatus Dojkabacteria bacterium]